MSGSQGRRCLQWRVLLVSVSTGGGARRPGIPGAALALPACHLRLALARISPGGRLPIGPHSPGLAPQPSGGNRRDSLQMLHLSDGCASRK